MIKGFGILEMIMALTLSLTILSLVVASMTDVSRHSKKITSNQEKLEAIFHAVDTVKGDLTKCGMRLQEAGMYFGIPLYESQELGFKIMFGVAGDLLEYAIPKGERVIEVTDPEPFKPKKKIIIYDPEQRVYEFNYIKGINKNDLSLAKKLKHTYSINSRVVMIKEVTVKLHQKECVLKRKTDRGYFQPLLENVTDFFIKFYPDSHSILYRIEVEGKEQIRGYIFLQNLV